MQFITIWFTLTLFVASLTSAVAEVRQGYAAPGETLVKTSSESFNPYPNTTQTGLPTESFSHFPTESFAPYPSGSATSSISSANSVPGIGNGTPVKAFRLQCDSDSLELVQSQTRPGVYYLRGTCGGLYNDVHASRCSFLDLSMCYTNDGGNIRPQRMGHFLDSCDRCVLYTSQGTSMLACTCAKGDHNGGGTQETAVQLDNLLYVKNGFLSCHGYTDFECPEANVPF
ncbi:hypothetical protein F4813DRAFT_390949 [Daldinia decipiens]|uniref:uncharacterized protein n=1 Tax=Daldinia decipiens TaxID=326647 RepID=UPI0020C51F08|nr:uncharacterized protein F4813DRAFT_390949 [Daldinia decipiens]KAI1656268.1 hypothetical protein F4813DRAFT_390949 [Daldinia decipiens]